MDIRVSHYIHDIDCPYMAIFLCRFWTTLYRVESRPGTALHVVLTCCQITPCNPLTPCNDMPKYGVVCSCQSLSLLCPYIEILDDISISVSVCLIPFYLLSDFTAVSGFQVICPNMELSVSVSHCPFYSQFLFIFCP